MIIQPKRAPVKPDGETAAGEFKSLAAWNITSFNLTSDGVEQDIGSRVLGKSSGDTLLN